MTTRCKFTCVSVTKTTSYQSKLVLLYTARFTVVTNGSKENDEFFRYTPSGTLEIGTYKEDVFEVGKDYYLDVSPCPPPV